MKITVQSADLVRYNANVSGKLSPDCVKRAISLAFDIPYSQLGKMLNDEMKSKRADAWNRESIYLPVMHRLAEERGGKVEKIPVWRMGEQPPTLNELVDTSLDPNQIYLVHTGKKPGVSDHIVCVRDGKIWDSWDSRNQYVKDYFTVGNISSKTVTNIREELPSLANYVMNDVVNNETARYMNKKGWGHYPIEVETRVKNYQLTSFVTICLTATAEIDVKRYYDFKVTLTIEPTMTEEEAKAFVQKAAKQKTYDRMWVVNEQEKKLAEEYEMKRKISEAGINVVDRNYYYSKQEQKFIDTLPGWVKPLIKYVNIQNPGQYLDSYVLEIAPLPDDPVKRKKIYFEAYESSHIRDMLNRYKNGFEVPGEDYQYSEEY